MSTIRWRTDAARCRFTIGLALANDCRRLTVALVASLGRGCECRVEIVDHCEAPLPRRLARALRYFQSGRRAVPGRLALLAAELAESQAMAVEALLARWPDYQMRVLAIGVVDPGCWSTSRGGLRGYSSLCDAARLADMTGINVIDAFPARDLAQEGVGGPLAPIPLWILLHHGHHHRLLVELGRTTRLTWLPAARDGSGVDGVATSEAGPGMGLLAPLARLVSKQHAPLATESPPAGQVIVELLDRWLSEPACFERSQLGAPPSFDYLCHAHRHVAAGASSADLLCTARALVVEMIARTIIARSDDAMRVDEVVLAGPGSADRALLAALAERLPELPLVPSSELVSSAAVLDAAVPALLAILHRDQTPACPTAISGARVPRVLGRLTPGSPQLWHRLLREMAAETPAVVSLRSAI